MNNPARQEMARDILVLGGGTWGITLSHVLAENSHRVSCWDIDEELIGQINRTRRHPKLETIELHDHVEPVSRLNPALGRAEAVVIVVPSRAMRSTCQLILEIGEDLAGKSWIICSKGIEQDTLMLMHEVLEDVLGEEAGRHAGLLSGPSHAEEVSRGLPATLTASAASPDQATCIRDLFFRPYLRVYSHDDMKGVGLGGALKNVIAIAAGIADGMQLGDNARAALITRGLAEIVRLGVTLGACRETFMGLSGMGDLIVTAASRLSRNHLFGELLANDVPAEQALEKVGMVVEGYPTAESAWQLSRKHGVDMPIIEAVYRVLYKAMSPRNALKELLSRQPKPEHY
jgi:glycerol-3-phosphate dehydrogenase (NAD(P)+)